MKRAISCYLAFLLLLAGTVCLFGCAKESGLGETETTQMPEGSETETDVQTEPGIAPLKLVENGKSDYVLVYPNGASNVVLSAVDFLRSSIEAATGIHLTDKSDNLRGKPAHDPNEKAILLGNTNYDESKEVFDTLGRFEYKIEQVGNKMVIAATDDSSLLTAVNYYVAHLLKPNLSGEEGCKTLVLEEYHFVPDQTMPNLLSINGTDVTEFSIVYPKGDSRYETISKRLQSVISDTMGVKIPIYADSDQETEHEILIGKTSRNLSQRLYSNIEKYIMVYSLEVSGSKMQLLSGGYASASRAVDDMRFSVFGNGVVAFTDGSYEKTKIVPDALKLEDGADVRIMSANILLDSFRTPEYKEMNSEWRAEILAGLLLTYKPDAVGLQEAGDGWLPALEKLLTVLKDEYGIEYAWHHQYIGGGKNYTNILFRSDLYECVKEDHHVFSYSTSEFEPLRNITMCKLQSKTDSAKQFVLMNTHWDTYEDKKYYQTLAAEWRGERGIYSEVELAVGRYNIETRPPLFEDFLRHEIAVLDRVIEGKSHAREIDVENEIRMRRALEELL